jgi:glutamate---cysteine ligase / carboxylate-amine ligase
MSLHEDFLFHFGIEEEFFVGHQKSRNVTTKVPTRFIEKAKRELGENVVEHELLQCQVELVSPILESMEAAQAHLIGTRTRLSQIAASQGLSVIAAGTHPLATWTEQEITDDERYNEVLQGFQILGRRNLLCGLHIHVAIPEGLDRVQLMNRAMRWLPLFLGFSTSSPFWNRHRTGLLSYRQSAFDEWPRSGIPDFFSSELQYGEFASRLVSGGAMKDASYLWWAIRPSLHYPTLELRIADACTYADDSVALACLYRALIAYLVRHPDQGKDWSAITRRVVDENRWRAKRYSIRAQFIDDRSGELIPFGDFYRRTRTLVIEDARRLGCASAFDRLDHVLRNGTSAHQQLAVYAEKRKAGLGRVAALKHVVDWLAQNTSSTNPDADSPVAQSYEQAR